MGEADERLLLCEVGEGNLQQRDHFALCFADNDVHVKVLFSSPSLNSREVALKRSGQSCQLMKRNFFPYVLWAKNLRKTNECELSVCDDIVPSYRRAPCRILKNLFLRVLVALVHSLHGNVFH